MDKVLYIDKQLFLYIYNNTNKNNIKSFSNFITKVSKPFFIVFYIILLILIYNSKNNITFVTCIIKPLLTLIICKYLRKKINRKRPYLVFDDLNLPTKKDASLPSNHTASSFIIAFMYLFINFKVALFFIILAFLVSISRIISGLHFPLDILTGFFISLSIYLII